MALIKCKKCGKEISDKSTSCVHCGYKYKRKKYKWLIILICFLVGIIFLTFLGFVSYVAIDYSKFTGTWTNVTDYYDRNDTSKFICRVESTLKIDDYEDIIYKSEVVSGECDYDKKYIRGEYTYDFNSIDALFDDYKVKVFYNDDYLCIDDCEIEKNRFYKDKNDNVIRDYIYTYDYSDNSDEHLSDREDFSQFKSITYEEYKNQILKNDKFIIFIGSKACSFCQELKGNIDNINKVYELPEIYFLDIDTLTDIEQIELFEEINNKVEIPVLRIYNNGLKDTFIGLQNEKTLIYSFIKYGLLNNNSL